MNTIPEKEEARKHFYIEEILSAYPELEANSTKIDLSGENSDVIILNDSLIFRFPKYLPGIQLLDNELDILKNIQTEMSLPIPQPEFNRLSPAKPGKVFTGYAMIPGQNLWRGTFSQFTPAERKKIARQLGNFMNDLHSIPLSRLPFLTDVLDSIDDVRQLYNDFQEYLYHHMRPDACETVSQDFENYFNSADIHPFEPCLRHGDFGPSNILFDPETKTISGIIDFGFCGLGDPAYDLAAVSCLGENILSDLEEVYPFSEHMLKRAEFYKSTFALMEALHGAKFNDSRAFEAGIQNYR